MRATPLGRAVSLTLLVGLLWSATLGLLHRTVHAGLSASPRVSVASTPPSARAEAPGLIDALLGEHRGASDCRLFDQSVTSDALTGVPPLPAWPLPVAAGLPAAVADAVRPCHPAFFLARGPPVLR